MRLVERYGEEVAGALSSEASVSRNSLDPLLLGLRFGVFVLGQNIPSGERHLCGFVWLLTGIQSRVVFGFLSKLVLVTEFERAVTRCLF